MTTPTNWPNPERPGAPLFPGRDGWHVLWAFGGVTIEWWSADTQEFDNYYDPEYTVYEHACLTPTQIAEMLAGERERVEAEMGAYVKNIMDAHPEWNMEQLHSALKEREAIRNLGDAP